MRAGVRQRVPDGMAFSPDALEERGGSKMTGTNTGVIGIGPAFLLRITGMTPASPRRC